MYCSNIVEPVEADVGWRIANAVDWQPQRLVGSSSTGTAAPYAEGIGGQSERAIQNLWDVQPVQVKLVVMEAACNSHRTALSGVHTSTEAADVAELFMLANRYPTLLTGGTLT